MGLDMYLEKRTYIKNWSHMKKDQLTKVKITGKKAKGIRPDRISYIIEEMAYWRKANQIHDYFIRECADGDGNKTEMYVSVKQLEGLLERCRKVLKASKLVKGKIKNGSSFKNGKEEPIMEDGKYIEDPTVAKELLPTTEGFFFGGTDYDEYYLADIKETIKVLKSLLSEEGHLNGEYYYIASW